eukprot:5755180-Pyramimonas_sp.AAC.1
MRECPGADPTDPSLAPEPRQLGEILARYVEEHETLKVKMKSLGIPRDEHARGGVLDPIYVETEKTYIE